MHLFGHNLDHDYCSNSLVKGSGTPYQFLGVLSAHHGDVRVVPRANRTFSTEYMVDDLARAQKAGDQRQMKYEQTAITKRFLERLVHAIHAARIQRQFRGQIGRHGGKLHGLLASKRRPHETPTIHLFVCRHHS